MIRRAKKSDRESVGRLWAALMESHAAIDDRFAPADDARLRWNNDFEQWLNSDSRRLLVAVDHEQVCGFATAERWGPPPVFRERIGVYIGELFVDPDYRRKGHGRDLIDAIRSWGEEIGAAELRAGVVSGNETGRAFWKEVGGADVVCTFSLPLEAPDKESEASSSRIGFRL